MLWFSGKKLDATPKIGLLPGDQSDPFALIRASPVICSCFLSFASSPLANQLFFVQPEGKGIAPYEFDQLAQLLSGSLRCHCWRCVADRG